MAWERRPAAILSAPNTNEAEPLIWTIFFRALQTFDAAVLLADRGYGPQALMLGRSIFEDMVVAQRTRREPKRARDAFFDHFEHSREVYRESLRELGVTVPPDLDAIPPLDPENRRRLDKKFGPHGHRLWTEDRIREMLDEVQADSSSAESRALSVLYADYLLSNRVLHNTPLALNQPLFVGGAELLLPDALRLAYGSFARATSAALDVTSEDEVTILSSRDSPLFIELTAESRSSIGRNDPCPCGSGRKYKRCHGAIA
jgi:hypothetical protein